MKMALELSGLSAGYRKLTVVHDISIGLQVGETLGILGPNGAGKTTLLKAIAGLLPSSGTVLLSGQSLQSLPAFERARSGLNLVPEGRQIFGELTVEQNLLLALNSRRDRDAASANASIHEVYDLFPILSERRTQLGGSLSGGQQQMLAIGRAFVGEPKVLLLDEPTQGLAPVIVGELANVLRRLKSRFSVIIVEQNRPFVEGLADRLLRMDGGRLVRSS